MLQNQQSFLDAGLFPFHRLQCLQRSAAGRDEIACSRDENVQPEERPGFLPAPADTAPLGTLNQTTSEINQLLELLIVTWRGSLITLTFSEHDTGLQLSLFSPSVMFSRQIPQEEFKCLQAEEVRYNTALRQPIQKKQRTLKTKSLRLPLPQFNHFLLILAKAFFRN